MSPEVEDPRRASDPAEGDNAAGDRIDRFVAERLSSLSRQLPGADERLDPQLTEEVDALDRLSRLRQKHLNHPRPERRWLMVGLLALTATVITLLVFMRVRSMPVELEIHSRTTEPYCFS